MGKRRQRQRRSDSSTYSSSSSSDDMSTEETPSAAGSSDIRDMFEKLIKGQRKQDKGIKRIFKELKEIKIKFEKLNANQMDTSPATQQNGMQPPRFQLRITSTVNKRIVKGQSIQTSHGNSIHVGLYDDGNPIAHNHPFASAWVMMVVLNGEFNKDNNQCNWSKESFEKYIRRPRQSNSTIGDGNHRIESIVSDCTFQLVDGSQCFSKATILENSGNKNVRLGVMVLSHSEERVLEGLSNHFKVQDPPKKSKAQKNPLFGRGQEQNGATPNMMYSMCSTSTQNAAAAARNGIDPVLAQLPPSENTVSNAVVAQLEHPQQLCTDFEGNHHSVGNELPITNEILSTTSEIMLGVQPSCSLTGVQYWEHIIGRVQLLWDRPHVEPRKPWNLHDQSMPLYNSQIKMHSGGLATIGFIPKHYDRLSTYSGYDQRSYSNEQAKFLIKLMRGLKITTIPKEAMQTHRNRGVLIRSLEPDDEDDGPPLKKALRRKYQLRFVNEVCKIYYTWEKIKANNGDLVKVALFDENNTKIVSGPLSSASVEFVVLHGDFNNTVEDDWTSDEFSSYVVSPESGTTVLGGHHVLVLVDGEASLGDAFFQRTSLHARAQMFKMGVILACPSAERVQEGVSEPFWVRNRQGEGSTTSKQHNAQLTDDLCPLENIYQYEDYSKSLVSYVIHKAGDFLKNSPEMDEEKIRRFLQIITSLGFNLKDIVDRAKSRVGVKYLPSADTEKNDNEDTIEEVRDGDSGIENLSQSISGKRIVLGGADDRRSNVSRGSSLTVDLAQDLVFDNCGDEDILEIREFQNSWSSQLGSLVQQRDSKPLSRTSSYRQQLLQHHSSKPMIAQKFASFTSIPQPDFRSPNLARKNGNSWGLKFRAKYMSSEEIESVLRLSACHISDHYVDDYYHQACMEKRGIDRKQKSNLFPTSIKDFPSKPHCSGDQQVDAHGKETFCSIRRLRPLFEVGLPSSDDGSHDQRSTMRPLEKEPMLAARVIVEDAFGLLLEVDDIDRLLQSSEAQDKAMFKFEKPFPFPAGNELIHEKLFLPNPLEISTFQTGHDSFQLRRRRQLLLQGVAASLGLVDPLGSNKSGHSSALAPKDDLVFLHIAALPKGRKLLARYLRLLIPGSELTNITCLAIFRHFRFLFRQLPSDISAAETTMVLAETVSSCVHHMDHGALSAFLDAAVCSYEQPPLRRLGSSAGDGASLLIKSVLDRAAE